MEIDGTNLERVAIVDDDKAVRDAYEDFVSELNLTPVSEAGPLPSLNEYLLEVPKRADAAICDHHLKVQAYAQFNGAELVAHWYNQSFPALLCTRWERVNIDELRPYRKRIPVLLRPQDINPDTLVLGIEQVLREFDGNFKAIRKPWRALIRIEEVDADVNAGFLYFVVPSWSLNDVVSLKLSELPRPVLQAAVRGKRLHAQVNIGAESDVDLYFDAWETE